MKERGAMRILAYVALGLMVCGNAAALETAAGADTVNASQVGINAKIEAGNAILTSGLNNILKCNQDGKFFDSLHNVCTDPTEPLAKKIAACTTNKQFYNQTTDSCQSLALPPDLTGQTNSNTSLINAIVNCNNQGKFYNSGTGTCAGAGGGVSAAATVACTGKASQGQCATPQCPAGYYLSGCSIGSGQTGYVEAQPNGNGCYCMWSHGGGGNLSCWAYCVK
jgi:hypothetical protein